LLLYTSMSLQSDLPNEKPTYNANTPPEPDRNSNAARDLYELSGDFRDSKIYIQSTIQGDTHWNVNRRYMLQRVRNDWVESVLEPAKVSHSFVGLRVRQQPGLIKSPWDQKAQRRINTTPLAASSNEILPIFDSANGNLLILGEPGAGKTITLLQLANELVLRAENNPEYQVPVVLNLASWSERHKLFESWLIEELRGKYFMPKTVAEAWVRENALTFLLDGLDELPKDERPACVDAINLFRQSHGPAQIVICSRRADYENQPQRLQLDRAIFLQALDQPQIDQILAKHTQGRDVAMVLQQDTTLREFSQTPLMLSIMLMASQEISAEDWSHLGSPEAHRERLFDIYLKYVFRRRSDSQTLLEKSTLYVLDWLGRTMSERSQTVFLMEGLSPDWLKTKWQRLGFTTGMQLISATLIAIVIGLVYIFAQAEEIALKMALAVGLATLMTEIAGARLNNRSTLLLSFALTSVICGWALNDLYGGLIFGLIFGSLGGAVAIAVGNPRMTDRLYGSWILPVLLIVIIVEVCAGILIDRIAGIEKLATLAELLSIVTLPIVLGITLASGWRPRSTVAQTVRPNQRFWQSLGNMAVIATFLVLILIPLSLPSGLSKNLETNQDLWDLRGILSSLLFVLSIGLLFALPIGFLIGGAACLQHLIVRSILVATENLPWNLVKVLDHAADRILLQRVGGGYIFQHRLLQEYFANSKPKEIERE
jgi:hypothetical protein